MHSFSFDAIGTRWLIDVCSLPHNNDFEKIKEKIHSCIEVFDKTFSRFRADSLVSQIARSSGEYAMPPEARKLFGLYKRLYELTEGSFTPLVGQILADMGYDAMYSLQSKHVPSAAFPWEDVLEYSETENKLTVKRPVLLDFGAAGKGYLADIVGELICCEGAIGYCIDAGGDLVQEGRSLRPIRIGLEDPEDQKKVIGIAYLANGSICASATNRRTWGQHHHIVDGRRARPVTDVIATWVIADDGLHADALATCLFFTGAHTLRAKYTFEYLLIRPDRTFEISPQFPGELFV